jgi:iron complex outermembrane receptor protein
MLRFGASKALRTPTLFEEKVQNVVIGAPSGAVAVSGGNLQPETIVSTEIGYIGEWPELHTTLDLKLFYESLHDLIGLTDPGSGFPAPAFPRTIVNGDSARQRGIEGQLAFRPSPDTSILLSAAHMDSDSTDRIASYSTSAPRDTVHLLMSHRFAAAWEASASVQYQSSYRPIGVEETQPAFTRVDLRLGKRMNFAKSSAEVAVVIENLFDERYTEFRPENVAQRRAWLTFRANF